MTIHPAAIVSNKANLHESVEIGPYSVIGDGVTVGKNSVIGPHVVIEGTTIIGENCRIFQFASIGAVPQDLKFNGEDCPVVIGNNNMIREFVTIHKATSADIASTVIGEGNLLMAYCHVAHNCKLGNRIVLANGVNLAGHVHIDDYAIIGGMSGVHQFTRIGCHSFIGGASAVAQDIPPYVSAAGNRVKLFGLNQVGLKRRGFSDATIDALKKAYRIIFRSSLLLSAALEKIRREVEPFPEIERLVSFIETAKRGICR